MRQNSRKALIIGGGIAGPTTAIFLKQAGIDAEVFEAWPYATGIGGGLQIAPNGMHVLAEMALDLPFGIGPLQFNRYFPEDTHNSYLNAFMSGGWLSGICYPALVFVTSAMGFRYIFVRVPWQRTYLAIFAAFLGTVGESFIIDTDHWRHFWMMLGAMWGLFAAAQRWMANAPRNAAPAS